MGQRPTALRIAYVNYGEQSGVTVRVRAELEALGHHVVPVFGRGPLELRDPVTHRIRPTPLVVAHLAAAALRFGPRALQYRWNTPFAFDVHARWAGELLAGLPAPVDVVLQNGALFSPGLPPVLPYVVYVDHTRAMAERSPSAASPRAPSWGRGWFHRERATYAGAASIATFSEHAAQSLRDDYGVEPDRISVVGAGANVLPPRAERTDDGETVLFIGREFERKGGLVLLDAFRRLRRSRPRAKLVVVGPAERLALPEGAVQVGPVAYEALPALFSRATLFALPTLREPFGIAYLDAMACGVPCVGSRIEAVPEIVEDGRSGLLVPPGDGPALAAALERLLAHPSLARAMGERGRDRVVTRFTWAQTARRLSDQLAAALRRHQEQLSGAAAFP